MIPSGPRRRLLALLGLVVGCAEPGEPTGACGGEACALPTSRAELLASLEGLHDPVAEYFRTAAADDGSVGADWEEIVGGVGAALGCDDAQRSTFVVLSNLGFAPKAVVTHCTDDPLAASRVLTIFEPHADDDDLDPEHFRIAAFDDTAGSYRRYQIAAHEGGGLSVVAEPEFCLSCHGGQQAVVGWSPIMNEMTNPWAQWNATPGFESFMFEDPRARTVDGPTFDALAERLDSASNLEPVVRSGIDRYVAAWIGAREAAPELDAAAALLRPVFCDETLNYVSEVHRSGELLASAVIDPAVRKQLLAIDPAAWPWDWVYDDALRIAPPAEDDAPMALIAVRGELAVQAEAALVSRQVLTPLDVLRVRALDWIHPVGSSLRCGVLESGLERAAIDPAAHADAGELARALFDAVMQPFAPPPGSDLIAIPDADDPQIAAAIARGDLSAWASTLAAWGDAIEVHVGAAQTEAGRATLEAERIRRGCLARRSFPIAPLIPGTEHCG
jgi:hypothetical protein